MKDIFKSGSSKEVRYLVKEDDVASFKGEIVHPVCSTFTLAREVEWATRQFVLDMRDGDEEGIGTSLTIKHRGPAFVGEELIIEASIININSNELMCSFIVRVGGRIVATGETGQKILKREKITKLFSKPKTL